MNQTKKLKCWFFGHEPNFPHTQCGRCKFNMEWKELTKTGFYYRARNFVRNTLQ